MLERGSEWRRWDLHVHTPDTILANEFGDWESYIAAIEAQGDVVVMGVTDYMSLSNYSKLKEFKDVGRIKNIALLIPNIEFRLAPPSDKATALNIHLLVSPDDPEHERKISEALARLVFRYDGAPYSCTREQLIRLGLSIKPNEKDEKTALANGAFAFKPDFATLREWYQNEGWLNENSFVAVAGGADGLSGFRNDGGWAAHREEITRFSDIIFSARPGEISFWVLEGDERDKDTCLRLGGPKPCVHGSDAHSLEKLFRPDQDRFCWIKGDTTFEGLKQILFEPAHRVHIGPTPPMFHDSARVIKTVSISQSSGWFDDISIPINGGLVSVIGQKGTGKSALAELIAYAGGDWADDGKNSFLHRARPHLEGLTVELEWEDGSVSSIELWDEQPDQRSVRYLSQKFVERLCAEDHQGGELVREIESVIFSHIDPTETLNASSFQELRSLKTEGVRIEGERIRRDIIRLIREESELRLASFKLKEKKERIAALAKERDGLLKQLPKVVSEQDQQNAKELMERQRQLVQLQRLSADDNQKLQKIEDIRSRVGTFKTYISRFVAEVTPTLKEIGIADTDHALFRPAFPGDVENPLTQAEEKLKRQLAELEGSIEKPKEGTIRWLVARIAALMKKETDDKAQQEKIRAIQTRIVAIEAEIQRIEVEITKIEGPDREQLTKTIADRKEAYKDFFVNLSKEDVILKKLYGPVEERLHKADDADAQEKSLQFSIRWEADVPKWIERGSGLFDKRHNIPYQNVEGLTRAANQILKPAWISGDPEKVTEAHSEFLKEFNKEGFRPSDYLRMGVSIEDVLLWLFETDHIRITYGLKYNGAELENLSPGTKGIVLLILYLGVDTEDTRHLIIDQPDENLDNESIYALLTSYFRRAKQRRQIILITHNPNLVVNADSDEVVIASLDRHNNGLPHITYESGALENTIEDGEGIRQQVCRILEGGSDAFRKRERRYSLR